MRVLDFEALGTRVTSDKTVREILLRLLKDRPTGSCFEDFDEQKFLRDLFRLRRDEYRLVAAGGLASIRVAKDIDPATGRRGDGFCLHGVNGKTMFFTAEGCPSIVGLTDEIVRAAYRETPGIANAAKARELFAGWLHAQAFTLLDMFVSDEGIGFYDDAYGLRAEAWKIFCRGPHR